TTGAAQCPLHCSSPVLLSMHCPPSAFAIPLPALTPTPFRIALRFTFRERRRLTLACLLQFLVLPTESLDLMLKLLDPPIPLIDPTVSPRDFLLQVRDALLPALYPTLHHFSLLLVRR